MSKISSNLEKILINLGNSKVNDINIVNEIEQSFLDYSMSVITARALPDLKDGLKPVHRRIIFAAHQEGLYNNKKFKKSAALVGTVMGSYHPHGDSSIYDALARMSQDFSMRYPLIAGQGNFGSIDGDSPAAMRYTEVKLSKLGEYFLDGIKEDCVDFVPNYDGSKEEPVILPTILPNILLNGCTGIAVGLATNIPPHNLGELCDAVIALIDNPNLTKEEIENYVKGPDFPTGGEVLNYSGVSKYFNSGQGSFLIRSKVIIEEEEKKNLLIVKEIPYGIKKINLIKKIVSLVKPEKKEEAVDILQSNITNIRDESNLEGIRLIIECKKDVKPEIILNNLYKLTQLQESYSANLTVLVNLEPKVLDILNILKLYLHHQIDMLNRRTKFNLQKIKNHIHILQGREIVANHLLEVIEIISQSPEPEETMIKKYELSDIQIKDIFSLPLRSIKKIEQMKLLDELKKELSNQQEHEEILASTDKQYEIIKNKVLDLKKQFGDDRKTRINLSGIGNIKITDLISSEKVVVTLSEKGYISQIPLSTFKLHRRGGVGVRGNSIYQDDKVKMMSICCPIDDILVFTNLGKVYKLKVYELSLNVSRVGKGQNIGNLLSFISKTEKIVTIIPIAEKDYENSELAIFFATQNGIIKKCKISLFKRVHANGKISFNLRDNDHLKFVILTDNASDILLASSDGRVERFKSSDMRYIGRTAIGVKSLKLKKGAVLVSASSSLEGDKVITITERGRGKINSIDKFRLTTRRAVGVYCHRISAKTGNLLACTFINNNHEILLMTNKNKINRFNISEVSEHKNRATSGVILFKLEDEKEKIVYFAKNLLDSEE